MVQRAIRSVLNAEKTGIHSRILVVDDGSTDGTEDALRHYGGLVDYEKLATNSGVGLASQFALEMVDSEFFVRLDSDDYLSKHFLSTTVPILGFNGDFGLVTCDYMEVDEFENQIKRLDLSNDATYQDYGAGMVFRTESVRLAGGYNQTLRHREDLDLHRRLLATGLNRFHVPVPLYRRRVHGGNLSSLPEHTAEKQRIENQ